MLDRAARVAADAARARRVRADGTVQVGPGVRELDAAMSQPLPFWLDIPELSAELSAWLGDALGLHPLVIEDAEQFGELPKLEVFDDYIAVVLYGPGPGASLDQLSGPAEAAAAVDVSSLDALGEVHGSASPAPTTASCPTCATSTIT